MNFTSVELVGRTNIALPVYNATPSDRFLLKGIDGLGPPEVDVSITNTLYQGGVYQGRRPQNRELVILVGLNPDYLGGETVSDLRTELYGLLTTGNLDPMITVRLTDSAGFVVAETYGYIKRIETPLFTKTPEAQITIPCLSPYLSASSLVEVVGATPEYSLLFDNQGTVGVGFRATATFTANSSSGFLQPTFNIRGGENGGLLSIVYNFLEGDELVFDTRPGKHYIAVNRPLEGEISLMNNLSTATWLQLTSGQNVLYTKRNPNATFTGLEWTSLVYTPQFWGA